MSTRGGHIRVLVVDDSAFMRNTLATMLMKFKDIQVVGTAKTGREAVEMIRTVSPDVMTLDIDMPEMNGLEVLERVMKDPPLPVVLVSGLTQAGAEETFQALLKGAFDFSPKHQGSTEGDLGVVEAKLYERIRTAFDNKDRFLRNRKAVARESRTSTRDGSGKIALKKREWSDEHDGISYVEEASSTVFGMNRAVWEAGLADEIVPLPQMGRRVMEIVGLV